MKKHFTFGIFLFLLLGVGSNIEATTFTSGLSSLTNPPISTQTSASNKNLRIGAWNARSTWYPTAGADTVTNVANYPLPTYLDDVTISAGDSIYINTAGFCKTLTVNGTVCMSNGGAYVNGDLTVNNTGIFSIKSGAFCKSIYNYGKIWAYSQNYNGGKNLCIGYGNQGTTATCVASTDSITFYNDGVVGGLRDDAVAVRNGCGIFVYFSNQAKALNFTGSAGSMPNRTFNAGCLLPGVNVSGTAATTAATQNFSMYIRNGQSLAFFVSGSPGITSLQNGDVFTGYTRNCTIEQGASLYVANCFHCKTAAPTASQGAMTYNIFGTLDLATYNRSKNEFDLYTSANSDSVIVNVKNGGTLVFGKVIGLVQSAAGQTTLINAEPGSLVKFGYTASAPTITLTNSTFPASLYNLEIATGTNSVTLPASLRVKTALTLTSGKVTLGNYNLTAASLTGGSASSYAVTSGTGTLTLNASTSGTLFPIGTATGYAPVTITPASNDTVSALVSSTATGSYTGYAVNANEWTLTPQVATTAALAFTPTTAANTTSPVIFSGSGYAAKADATVTGSTYSASGFSLGTTATIFATGGTTPSTALKSTTNNDLLVYADNNSLVVRNAKVGDVVSVYAVSGLKVASSVVKGDNVTMTLKPGVYFVKTGSTVQKVILQ